MCDEILVKCPDIVHKTSIIINKLLTEIIQYSDGLDNIPNLRRRLSRTDPQASAGLQLWRGRPRSLIIHKAPQQLQRLIV